MSTLFVSVGTPRNALVLHEFLQDLKFKVFDLELTDTGNFVVFNTAGTKVRSAIKEAKREGVLEPPYRVKMSVVKPGRVVASSEKEEKEISKLLGKII